VKIKHWSSVENLCTCACLTVIGYGGLFACAPVIAQESSNQKSSRTNVVAQAAGKSTQENVPIVIVTHVDAMPPFTDKAVRLLREYRQDTLKDSGNKRIEILQQVGRPNHFSIVEEWANQKSFNEHESALHTRKFRSHMQEALGAPFDERPHTFIAP
jgi:quinol monooxygenase YgiN